MVVDTEFTVTAGHLELRIAGFDDVAFTKHDLIDLFAVDHRAVAALAVTDMPITASEEHLKMLAGHAQVHDREVR